MKIKIICLLLSIITVIFGCQQKDKKEKLIDEISSLEEKTFSQEKDLNINLAKELLLKYIEFADLYSDSLSPNYLLKASSIASGINNPLQAIECLDKIENNYPDYDKLANVIFQHAFVLENEVKDKIAAKEYYELFIEKYPSHILVEDAKNAISLMGLSDQELIKFLERTNKK